MKAKIVSEKVFYDAMDFATCGGHIEKRLVIEKNGELIAITPSNGHVFVFPENLEAYMERTDALCDIVDVPDEVIAQILNASELQKQLFEQIETLLK